LEGILLIGLSSVRGADVRGVFSLNGDLVAVILCGALIGTATAGDLDMEGLVTPSGTDAMGEDEIGAFVARTGVSRGLTAGLFVIGAFDTVSGALVIEPTLTGTLVLRAGQDGAPVPGISLVVGT
jgi:hypothetical protein